jgi:two-component system sensor histidine kinase RegB
MPTFRKQRPDLHSSLNTPLDDPNLINLSWLLRLRWGAIAGQATTIVVAARFMGVDLPLRPLFAIVAVELLSNVALALRARGAQRVEEWMLGIIMAFDVVLLTGLLYFSGGPSNPFSFLYLVHIALAAVVLRPRWTWALVALSLASFGLLFVKHVPIHGQEMHVEGHGAADDFGDHMRGMWVAFGVAACFIVYFVHRVTRALAERETELAAARKLASLATLAAGAAHELSTPLGTIAVVTRELERGLMESGAAQVAAADARLIREQVERCRGILLQMAADAGDGSGEADAPLAAREIVRGALHDLENADRVEVTMQDGADRRTISAPPRLLSMALRAVIENAIQASPPGSPVRLELSAAEDHLDIEVRDRGAGAAPEVLARAGEPFFTTKGPGRGMGLGLFLTRTVLDRLGGQVRLDSRPGEGMSVTLVLPAAPAAANRHIPITPPVVRG